MPKDGVDRVSTLESKAMRVDCRRRRLLAGTALAGGFATGMLAWPLVASLAPSERAQAEGAPVEVDISGLGIGAAMLVEWRGEPVWLVRRSQAMLATLAATAASVSDPESLRSTQPENCRNSTRSVRPEVLVVIGVCTHLGCSPTPKLANEENRAEGWPGGFLCACHGSTFDLAGRVFQGKPAPDNLRVPPYRYLTDNKIVIGEGMSA